MGFFGSVLWFLSGKEVWQKSENVAKIWQDIRRWIAKYMRKISDFSLNKIVKCSFAIHLYYIGRYSIKFKTQMSSMSISLCVYIYMHMFTKKEKDFIPYLCLGSKEQWQHMWDDEIPLNWVTETKGDLGSRRKCEKKIFTELLCEYWNILTL